MENKKAKYIFSSLVVVLAVVLIGLGIDIEMKLYKLSEQAPVQVYNVDETTANTGETVASSVATTVVTQPTTVVTTSVTVTASQSVSEVPSSENTESTVPVTTSSAATTSAVPSTTETTTTQTTATTAEPTVEAFEADQSFYVTKTGKKYHKADCKYLSSSKVKITVDEIMKGDYQPCSRCMKE